MNEVQEILEQRAGGLPKLLTFDEVKRGDTVKCMEGSKKGFTFRVRNRRLTGLKLLKYVEHHATHSYLCAISQSDCNIFELIQRA